MQFTSPNPVVSTPASRSITTLLTTWAWVFLSISLSFAVSPSLQSVVPPGARNGTDIEWTLNGARLDDAQEIVFLSPGFQVLSFDAKKTNQIKAIVRVAPEVPIGEHSLRVRTRSGWSELRTVSIGTFPHLKESEPNNEPSRAQPLTPNITVTGTIGSEDIDYYQFKALKGERWSAEVEAIRLGRVMFDPHLTLLNEDGVELQTADDSMLFLQDSMLSFIAPNDGNYRLKLRDASWGGGGEFHYRLHVGTYPRPSVAYPNGGPADTPTEVTLLGDPKGAWKQTVHPSSASPAPFQLLPKRDGIHSPSALPFRVVTFPNVLETSGNQDRKHATTCSLPPPFAVNGIIEKGTAGDWFQFKAPAKVPLLIQVYARRLRSPLDSVLQLCDASGKVIDTNDDSTGPDSGLKLNSDEGGTYYLHIQDQLDRGGPEFVYRIEVTPAQPQVQMNIPEVARNDSQSRQFIAVPRGNRMVTLMQVKRTQFTGDLQFKVPGLPAGVSFEADSMPGSVDTIPWVFSAAADASLAGSLVKPLATPTSTTTPGFSSSYRHTIELVRGGNDQIYYATTEDRLPVAVVQEIPFEVQFSNPTFHLTRSGAIKLGVQVIRQPEFLESVTLKMIWNPPGVASETEIVVPKDKSFLEFSVNAKADATLGTWKIAVLASSPWRGGTAYASTPLGSLKVSEPYVVGKWSPLNTEPGKSVSWSCKLEHKMPLPGKTAVKLVGLPDSVVTQDQMIDADSKEIVFDLKVDAQAKVGSFKNLACVATVEIGTNKLNQTISSGGTLRVVPAKKKSDSPDKVAKVATTP